MKPMVHGRLVGAVAVATATIIASQVSPAVAGGTAQGAVPKCWAGAVTGGGSTFVASLVEEWVNVYEAACPSTTLVYNAIGSGMGIQDFLAGQEDFGAADFMMPADDVSSAEAKGGPVVEIPWAAGAVALEFKIKGVLELNLTAGDIAGIFSGAITRWDNPQIRRANPGVPLPNEQIQVVYRSDGSGTTNALTSYLAAAAPSVWKYGSGDNWQSPAGQGAKGSDGVTDIVRSTEGAIGYAQLSYAEANGLGVANVRNLSGQYVAPDAQSVTSALSYARVGSDGDVVLDFLPPGKAAYPISTTTWAILYRHQASPQQAKLLRSFLSYAVEGGQSWAAELGYAPLTSKLVAEDLSEIATINS